MLVGADVAHGRQNTIKRVLRANDTQGFVPP